MLKVRKQQKCPNAETNKASHKHHHQGMKFLLPDITCTVVCSKLRQRARVEPSDMQNNGRLWMSSIQWLPGLVYKGGCDLVYKGGGVFWSPGPHLLL